MLNKIVLRNLTLLCLLGILAPELANAQTAQFWLTTPDKTSLFERQDNHHFSRDDPWGREVTINENQTFQTIEGFGFALTGGSALHLLSMDKEKRAALLRELFATDGNNIGISYLRVSIGSSDLNTHVYSYDDMPEGQTDPDMKHFSLDDDRNYVLPILKEILFINPDIKILGSPWSAPAWMKTNHDVRAGKLKPEYYDAYAKYFVQYIRAMQQEGITINAITPQNEPLNNTNTPSMKVPAEGEATFIKNHLGPAFQKAGIKTKIIIWDHNAEVPEYPLSILHDSEANQYIDGSGFHYYSGNMSALSKVHKAFPGKNIYFTEQLITQSPKDNYMQISAAVRRIILGATQNWSKNVILWNLASDPNMEPHTGNGGCSICQGGLTIDGNNVSRNLAYYTVAHASKFVRPGSVRIGSSKSEVFPNVAFKTPKGKIVLIVVNDSWSDRQLKITKNGKHLTAMLPVGAVGTFVW